MTPPKSEKTVLQAELRRVWGVVEILLGVLAGSVRMTGNILKVIIDEMAQLSEENIVLREIIKKMEQRIKIHESWNHSPAEATEYARNRRQFRKDVKEHKAKEAQAPHDQVQRKAGRQHGMPGISHHDRPLDGKKEFAADMCRQCGRTDLVPGTPIQKMVRELTEGRMMFLQYAITCGTCPDCKVVTYPHTDTIPGTSFGRKLMATLTSCNNESVSVKGIVRLIRDMFGARISAGAVSNCTSAKVNHMKGSVLEIHSKTVILKHDDDDAKLFYSPLCPPLERPESIYDYDAQIARHGTVWTSFMPLPTMVKILEKSTTEPWYRTDESKQQIGKKKVQTLVYDTLNTTMIHVEKDKKRPALYRCSSGMVFRPTTHDGYTGNRKLRYYRPPDSLPDKANDRLRKAAVKSEIHQRCFVHVLRNVEDVAMKKGIGSPEQAAHEVLLDLYKSAKNAASIVRWLTGGDLKSACQIDLVSQMPHVRQYVNARIAEFNIVLEKIVAACNNEDIATIISNAAPELLTFIRYPGMPPHNNDCEKIIRRRVVMPRRQKGPFPNKTAASNYSAYQTFAATCEKQNISVHEAVLGMVDDPFWDMFSTGIGPPIFKNICVTA